MALDLLVIAVAVAIEPIPLTALLLVLSTRRAAVNGLGFALGWMASLLAVLAATVLVTGGRPPRTATAPATALEVARLAIGVVLIAIGLRRRRRRGRPRPAPAWMAHVDDIGPVGAAVLAFLVQPWVLIAAGVTIVASADLSDPWTVLVLAAFALACSAGVIGLEVDAALRPAASARRLARLRRFVAEHTDQLIVGASIVVGCWLMATGAYSLATAS